MATLSLCMGLCESVVILLHECEAPSHDSLLGLVTNFYLLSRRLVCSFDFHRATNYVYPMRVRLSNILIEYIKRISIRYVRIINPDNNDSAEKKQVRVLSDALLQRCFSVPLHRLVPASKHGVPLQSPCGVDLVLAVPRIAIYAADQPEKRHALRLKAERLMVAVLALHGPQELCGILWPRRARPRGAIDGGHPDWGCGGT